MGIHRGPNIKKGGLVFGYDTNYGVADNGLPTRFYQGRPTTNISSTHHASGHNTGNYGNVVTVVDAPEKGDRWKKVTISNRGSNFRILQWQYTTHTSDVVYSHSAEFDWGNMREKSYQIVFDGNGGGTRNYYRNQNYSSNGGSNIDGSLQDGHFASNIVKSGGNHVHAWFIYHSTTGVSGLNDYFYYRDYQVEVNSTASPYTPSSRSNTQGLMDLTKTSNIDMTNMSYDTTGQPIFDGTNDYLVTDDNFLINGSQTWEIVAMSTGAPDSPAGILTNHHFQSPQSNFGINYVSGSRLGASIGYTDGSREYASKNTSYVIQENVPFHAVLKYDSSNNTIEWFINGISDSTYSLSATPNFIPQPICSGRWTPIYNDYYFNGEVYVGKVYGRALTSDEIKQNYNTYKNRFNL